MKVVELLKIGRNLLEVLHKSCGRISDIRMSCIFIGDATSPEQWWDTLAHELLDHAKASIKDYYGVPERGEDSAWLTGYLMRMLVRLFGVPCR